MFMSKFISKVVGDKRRWRQYKARIGDLPENYRLAVEALERYLMFFGRADGSGASTMFEDLADLFEQAAADGTPIREIFGADPVEFVDTFVQNYPEGQWMRRERVRFVSAVGLAAGEDPGREERTV